MHSTLCGMLEHLDPKLINHGEKATYNAML